MSINRNNYETYLALYLERKLDPVKTAELMVFFSKNPDIEKLHDISFNLKLQPEEINLPDKGVLKKNFTDVAEINDQNFDEFCIASSENLLEEYDEYRLQAYILQHPDKEKEANIYKRLKIKADLHIHFPFKSTLHKPLPFFTARRIVLMATSIAASITLIFWILTGKPESMELPVGYSLQNKFPATPDQKPVPAIDFADNEILPDEISYTDNRTGDKQELDTNSISEPEVNFSEISNLPFLTSIPAAKFEVHSHAEDITLTSNHYLYYALYDIPESNPQIAGREMFAGNILFNYIRRLNAWETTRIAVKGFNFLTESKLSIEKTSDDQGKVEKLIIDTEGFTLLATRSK